MPTDLVQVDAFTDTAFAGNPAAVALLPEAADADWMQRVAREMNLSETAFLVPVEDGVWSLRWFTPAVEVDLCGHATLAAAHVLWTDGHGPADQALAFETVSGRLGARRTASGWIELDFPAEPMVATSLPPDVVHGLGVQPVWTGTNRFDALLRLEDAAAVRAVVPDFGRLVGADYRGVMITAPADDPRYDFVSRFFAPAVGVDEDPVTGSAHCALGPYWAADLGQDEVVGYQASARGGVVRVRPNGDRVALLGQAVTVLRATLL